MTIVDPLTAKAILNREAQEYLSGTSKVKLLPFGAVIQLPLLALQMLRGRIWPERTHLRSQQRLVLFMRKARELARQEPHPAVLAEKLLASFIHDVAFNTVPLFILGKITLSTMKKMAGKESERAFAPLEVALPNNVTTQMGLALSRTAELLPDKGAVKEIQAGIAEHTLPEPFLSSWGAFLDTYGHTGPREIDVAAPRYHDDYPLLIGMVVSMRTDHKVPERSQDVDGKRWDLRGCSLR